LAIGDVAGGADAVRFDDMGVEIRSVSRHGWKEEGPPRPGAIESEPPLSFDRRRRCESVET
jgi:hypothetical protein